MKETKRTLALALALLLLAPLAARAGETEPMALLPAGSEVVLELNVRAILDSPATQVARDKLQGFLDGHAMLQQILNGLNLNPLEDIDTITLAAPFPRDGEKRGVALVTGTFDLVTIRNVFQGMIDRADPNAPRLENYQGLTVYHAADNDNGVFCLLDTGLIVFGDEQTLKAALDLHRGFGRGLDNRLLRDLVAGRPAGAAIWAAAIVPETLRRQIPAKNRIESAFVQAVVGQIEAVAGAIILDDAAEAVTLRLEGMFADRQAADTVLRGVEFARSWLLGAANQLLADEAGLDNFRELVAELEAIVNGLEARGVGDRVTVSATVPYTQARDIGAILQEMQPGRGGD